MSDFRGRRRASFAEQAAESSNYPGNFFCQESKVRAMKPMFMAGDNREPVTTLRILPALNPEDFTQYDPTRFSEAQLNFGDWIRTYWAVRSIGEEGKSVTFFLSDQPNEQDFDINDNPAVLLRRSLQKAIKAERCQPDWPGLLAGGYGRGAVIPSHKKMYIARGILYQYGDKLYPGDGIFANQLPYLVDLGTAAGRAVTEAVDSQLGAPGGPDMWGQFTVGVDPVGVGPGEGAFLRIFPGKHDPRIAAQAQQPRQQVARQLSMEEARRRPGATGVPSDAKEDGPVFTAFFEREFNGHSADYSQLGELVAARVLPWEDVLIFPSPAKQAEILSTRIPPSALLYAWQDHRDWIVDNEIEQRAAARTVFQVPAGGPGQMPDDRRRMGPPGQPMQSTQQPRSPYQQPLTDFNQPQLPGQNPAYGQPIYSPAAPQISVPNYAPQGYGQPVQDPYAPQYPGVNTAPTQTYDPAYQAPVEDPSLGGPVELPADDFPLYHQPGNSAELQVPDQPFGNIPMQALYQPQVMPGGRAVPGRPAPPMPQQMQQPVQPPMPQQPAQNWAPQMPQQPMQPQAPQMPQQPAPQQMATQQRVPQQLVPPQAPAQQQVAPPQPPQGAPQGVSTRAAQIAAAQRMREEAAAANARR